MWSSSRGCLAFATPVAKSGNVSPYGNGCRQRLMDVAKWRWVSPWRDIAVIKISPRRWLRHGAKALTVWRRPSPMLCNRPNMTSWLQQTIATTRRGQHDCDNTIATRDDRDNRHKTVGPPCMHHHHHHRTALAEVRGHQNVTPGQKDIVIILCTGHR